MTRESMYSAGTKLCKVFKNLHMLLNNMYIFMLPVIGGPTACPILKWTKVSASLVRKVLVLFIY